MRVPVQILRKRWAWAPVVEISRAGTAVIRLAISAVSQVFAIDLTALSGETRGCAPVAQARQVCMYLARIACGMSMIEAGNLFGRDRTAVAHVCSRIEDMRDDLNFFDGWRRGATAPEDFAMYSSPKPPVDDRRMRQSCRRLRPSLQPASDTVRRAYCRSSVPPVAASAARASTLMRSTIDERPLERCGERWSLRPSSTSSLAASTARMSAGGWS